MASKKKRGQSKAYLKRFKDNEPSAEVKAHSMIGQALCDIIPDEVNEEPDTSVVILLVNKMRMLKAEFPGSYKCLINYLTNGTPIADKYTPQPTLIVRYIITTLTGFDPIEAMIKELDGVVFDTTAKKKSRSRKKKEKK